MEILSIFLVPAALSLALFCRCNDTFQNKRGNGIVEATIFFIFWMLIAFVNHSIKNLIVKLMAICAEITIAVVLLFKCDTKQY